MAQNPCQLLHHAGTAVWMDQLSRVIVEQGELVRFIEQAALTGVTSNPAIFEKAMSTGTAYDEQLRQLAKSDLGTEQVYEELAVRDIQLACDRLRPVYEKLGGQDGFVSLEVSPHLARDTEGTYQAARRLHGKVDRPNLLIKIPGTDEGAPAIERCLAEGIPINITLLFSIAAYETVAEAYVRALEKRAAAGQSLDVGSVASFFVSRIDTLTDEKLEAKAGGDSALLALRGKIAIANAKLAYQSFLRIFESDRFRKLAQKGARVQRPLWASTSTKNPDYRDVVYVETLIGRDTVNTMPIQTIEAFLDHGVVRPQTVEDDVEGARAALAQLEEHGISFTAITDQLLDEAIQKFNEPYDKLLAALERKRNALRAS
ncbi:MAG: transaldolase [Candidatus Eisenbacteria bacterium]|uniref:Transaldolase n=1 Tax=Eiseniibacteriota bacterium TaxID=2212470 RepID=A0A956LXE0_UNCEI|nr:transaldolase [Candidatus Eisenbacteria bacterium]